MQNNKKTTFLSKSNLIFIGILLGFVLICFTATAIAMAPLRNWLVNFEAAQPHTKSQEIFNQYFTNPDWAQLYKTAGEKDTAFENENAYASYMMALANNEQLSFVETSAGTSGDHKYIVKAGDRQIAVFTLTADNKDDQVPNWYLGSIELMYQRNEFCNILTAPGNKVSINGVALDESYIVKQISAKAGAHLPEGTTGYQMVVYRVDNLLSVPSAVVTTADGQPVALTYDANAKTYVQQQAEAELTDDEKNAMVNAAQVYAKYMVLRATENTLMQYFDSSSKFYKTITSIEKWMQKCNGYQFGDPQITDCYRYSDTMYSALIDMSVFITLRDNGVKDYHLTSSMIMEKQNGKWICINMVNGNIQEQNVSVRLSYMDGDDLVHTEMVDAHAKKLTLPTVTAPEGMVLDGWYVKGFDANGKPTLDLAFKANETGEITLPSDTALEPMVLYARFVAKEA